MGIHGIGKIKSGKSVSTAIIEKHHE